MQICVVFESETYLHLYIISVNLPGLWWPPGHKAVLCRYVILKYIILMHCYHPNFGLCRYVFIRVKQFGWSVEWKSCVTVDFKYLFEDIFGKSMYLLSTIFLSEMKTCLIKDLHILLSAYYSSGLVIEFVLRLPLYTWMCIYLHFFIFNAIPSAIPSKSLQK